MKKLLLMFVPLLFAVFAHAAEPKSVALTPVDRADASWWLKRHADNIDKMQKGDIKLLMIGDSITHGWDREEALWNETFAQYNPINMGFGGDRTEHVLWRLERLPLDKIKPQGAVIMIGTNNIGHGSSTPAEAASGIKAIVERLQKQYPEIKVLVLHVFPRDEKPDGKLRTKVNEINALLPELFKDAKNVTLLDIGPKFLDADGTLPKDIMPDFLHPNDKGYKIWAEAITPALETLMSK